MTLSWGLPPAGELMHAISHLRVLWFRQASAKLVLVLPSLWICQASFGSAKLLCSPSVSISPVRTLVASRNNVTFCVTFSCVAHKGIFGKVLSSKACWGGA